MVAHNIFVSYKIKAQKRVKSFLNKVQGIFAIRQRQVRVKTPNHLPAPPPPSPNYECKEGRVGGGPPHYTPPASLLVRT